MNKRISVGAVSYLNTLPFLLGIKRAAGLMERIHLTEEYPAKLAEQLIANQIDVGLIPVAMIPRLKESYIIGEYCIGTEGAVASVALFSEVPMEQIDTVILDYQSRTSVNLARVLLKEYWKKEVVFQDATPDFREKIKGTTAAVVIGDRALEQISMSAYMYDLGAAWKAHTGLPFVFAAWVANKPLDEDFIDAFNKANAYGVSHIDEVLAGLNYPAYDLKKYYTENLSYPLTDEKRKGLALFLEKLKQL
ncbi:MAG: menaquinone biosynthesis protein [Sediminibacterium sp.]|nr:menaquinone biosynthesis protein [Sediminibacterium sp.]